MNSSIYLYIIILFIIKAQLFKLLLDNKAGDLYIDRRLYYIIINTTIHFVISMDI